MEDEKMRLEIDADLVHTQPFRSGYISFGFYSKCVMKPLDSFEQESEIK